ncbi:MAG: cupredoxin domain-containing protein [Candidatus Woesearchaeota archaeon]
MIKENKMNKYLIMGGAILIFLFIGIFSIKNFAFGAVDTNRIKTPSQTTQLQTGEVQNVGLSMANGYYVINPSILKVGVPVRMEVDMNTVVGCARDFTIPAFGVRKYVIEGDNIIKFTPTKTGTFNIVCSMNMYKGSFIVVTADGSSGDINVSDNNDKIVDNEVTTRKIFGRNPGGCGCLMMR